MSIHVLQLWRVSLCYGFEADLFLDMFPVLCQATKTLPVASQPHYALLTRQYRCALNVITAISVLASERSPSSSDNDATTTATTTTTTATTNTTATTTKSPEPPKFYAVSVGRTTGVFDTWPKTREQVFDYAGSAYKSFPTYAGAANYLKSMNVENTTAIEAASTTTTATPAATTTPTMTTTITKPKKSVSFAPEAKTKDAPRSLPPGTTGSKKRPASLTLVCFEPTPHICFASTARH